MLILFIARHALEGSPLLVIGRNSECRPHSSNFLFFYNVDLRRNSFFRGLLINAGRPFFADLRFDGRHLARRIGLEQLFAQFRRDLGCFVHVDTLRDELFLTFRHCNLNTAPIFVRTFRRSASHHQSRASGLGRATL
jgi:hypothetical protein